MSNMYTKSMSEALKEARDYRDPTNEVIKIHDAKKAKLKKESVTEAKGHLSYDEWLKKE